MCAPAYVFKYGNKDVKFLNFYPKFYSDYESFYLRTYNLNESEVKDTHICNNKIIRINEQLIYGYDKSK